MIVNVIVNVVLFKAHQHGGSEVKFVEELGDEDVVLHQVVGVSLFNVTDDLGKPLILLLGTRHPNEEYLERERERE